MSVPEEIGSFGKPGAGRNRREIRTVMRSDVPCRRPAHAETTHQNSVLVHFEMLLHVIERFEEIHLAREGAGVAIAPIKMEHNCVARRKLAHIVDAIPQEADLAQRLPAPVKPRIHAPFMWTVRRIRRRNHQSVRLHAPIDLRNIAAHYQAGRPGPWRVAVLQIGHPLVPHPQQFLAPKNVFCGEELVPFQGVTNRLMEDLDIGDIGIGFQRVDTRAQPGQPGFQLPLIGLRHRHARRRDQMDLLLPERA